MSKATLPSQTLTAPGSPRSGEWTLRIPVGRFREFIADLAKLGELRESKTDSDDVTDRYYDLKAHIQNDKAEEEALRKLMVDKSATGKLEDLLAVRRELRDLRGKIDAQQGQMKRWDKEAAMTAVVVQIQDRKDYVPSTSPSFGTSISRTFSDSVQRTCGLWQGRRSLRRGGGAVAGSSGRARTRLVVAEPQADQESHGASEVCPARFLASGLFAFRRLATKVADGRLIYPLSRSSVLNSDVVPMHTTPPSLLEQVRRPGDRRAWGKFVDLYTPLLFFWARRVGLREPEAADLVQDVFVLLVKKLPDFQYDRNKGFRAWLRAVALNRWREARRRIHLAAPVGDVVEKLPDPASDEQFWEVEYRRELAGRAMAIMRGISTTPLGAPSMRASSMASRRRRPDVYSVWPPAPSAPPSSVCFIDCDASCRV